MPEFRLFLVSLCLVFAVATADRLVLEARRNGPSWIHDHPLYVNIAASNDTVVIRNFPSAIGTYMTSFRVKDGALTSALNVSSMASNIIGPLFNGQWMGYTSLYEIKLFQLDNNGVTANSFSIPGSFIKYATILSDNTVVTLDRTTQLVSTYLFESANNTWYLAQQIPAPQPTTLYHNSGAWADDHFLVIANESGSANVFERVSNGTWEWTSTLQASVSVKSMPATYAHSVDTIILAYPFDQLPLQTAKNRGFLVFFTRVNGEWFQQVITSGDLGYRSDNGIELGLSFAVVNADTLLFGAPAEGYNSTNAKRHVLDPPGVEGKVVMLQRTNNIWTAVADIVRRNTTAQSYFGVALAVTSEHIVIVECGAQGNAAYGSCNFYTVPPCPFSSIDVTCSPVELNGCDYIDDESTALNAFTLNNPQCGDVSVSVTSMSKIDNRTVEVTLSFSRIGVSNTTCTSTVTCTPSSSNSPSGNMTPDSPTSSSPASAPTNTMPDAQSDQPSVPSKHVSSSSVFIANNLVVVLAIIIYA